MKTPDHQEPTRSEDSLILPGRGIRPELQQYAEFGINTLQRYSTLSLPVYERARNGEDVYLDPEKPNHTHADKLVGEEVKRLADELSRELKIKIPVLSDETFLLFPREVPSLYVCADPVDSSVHLGRGEPSWLHSMAFIEDGRPVVGIVACPARDTIYIGIEGQPSEIMNLDGSERRALRCERSEDNDKIICRIPPSVQGYFQGSRDGVLKFVDQNKSYAEQTIPHGSAESYLMVAAGAFDLFPNIMGNFVWDKAPFQVILEGVGAKIVPINWASAILRSDAESMRYALADGRITDDGHIVISPELVRRGVTFTINPEMNFTPDWWLEKDFRDRA